VYHRIVASKVRQVFAAINAGDWEQMVSGMAPTFTYRFYGQHALSGERHTAAGLRLWWQRIDRLTPGLTFALDDVLVAGWPWATRVATRVTVRVRLADGSEYQNVVMQFLRMRWGKVTEVRTLEDTVVLQRALDRLAAAGYPEAHADPITDADPTSSRSPGTDADRLASSALNHGRPGR
jgi:ketosteroid isomerase-like protein